MLSPIFLPLVLALGAADPGAIDPGASDPGDVPERVTLIATAATRAQVRPCHCPGLDAGGGPALRAHLIKQRSRGQDLGVRVDGGDMTPIPGHYLRDPLAELMVQSAVLTGYDAVAVGENELILGGEFLASSLDRVPWVCANLTFHDGSGPEIPGVRWVEDGDLRIAVTAYLDPLLYYAWPGAVERGFDRVLVADPVETLTPLVARLRETADLVVLLAHGDEESLTFVLENVPGIDIVVQGHEPPESGKLRAVGSARLVQPGPGPSTVVEVVFDLPADPAAGPWARWWDLKSHAEGDPRVREIVVAFEEEHGTVED